MRYDMSLPEVLKTALDQIKYIAKTETVFGEPVKAGDMTIIPISKVSIGFAAGGTNNEKSSGSGTGTGGGVQITPVALISIVEDKVRIHSLEKGDETLGKIMAMAPDIFKKISDFIDKGKKEREKKDSNQEK